MDSEEYFNRLMVDDGAPISPDLLVRPGDPLYIEWDDQATNSAESRALGGAPAAAAAAPAGPAGPAPAPAAPAPAARAPVPAPAPAAASPAPAPAADQRRRRTRSRRGGNSSHGGGDARVMRIPMAVETLVVVSALFVVVGMLAVARTFVEVRMLVVVAGMSVVVHLHLLLNLLVEVLVLKVLLPAMLLARLLLFGPLLLRPKQSSEFEVELLLLPRSPLRLVLRFRCSVKEARRLEKSVVVEVDILRVDQVDVLLHESGLDLLRRGLGLGLNLVLVLDTLIEVIEITLHDIDHHDVDHHHGRQIVQGRAVDPLYRNDREGNI
ncbi:MAG: hypothetical protein Q9187_000794 [Circinaria calcarea]